MTSAAAIEVAPGMIEAIWVRGRAAGNAAERDAADEIVGDGAVDG